MNKEAKKQTIIESLKQMEAESNARIDALSDRCSIRDYAHLVRESEHGKIWTDALQAALHEHEIVEINTSKEPYYIDDTVVIPSNRRIIAWRAVIRLVPNCEVLMLRNEHVKDGTHAPFDSDDHDENISIVGGKWEESHSMRKGYGASGRFARKDNDDGSFYGVSTCMLFNNMEYLNLKNVTFSHTAGFSVQMGNVKNSVFENIWFNDCYADGLHFGGNCENIFARHLYGEVGDDIFALNAYDWQNSSVTFGPIKNVFCDDVNLSPMGCYKAIRMVPGTYTFDDGSKVDCSISDIIIKNVRGIKTFKMYFQTPAYTLGTDPERGEVGSMNDVFFENITIDLDAPIDPFKAYCESDPVRGAFGAFEIGANTGYISFENIELTSHKDIYPLSYLVCIGPKSIVWKDKEIFDPYISCSVDTVELKNIIVNGERSFDKDALVRAVEFNDINNDGVSTAIGKIAEIKIS